MGTREHLADPEPIGDIAKRVWDELEAAAQPGFHPPSYLSGWLDCADQMRAREDAEAEALHRRAARIVRGMANVPEVPPEKQVPRTWAEREPVR